jgi:excinuclease ABC subunit A
VEEPEARATPFDTEPIRVRGARVHNLQGVDCDLPRNRLVVITGPSGSGKSSLAFDTLYAEGQRRYVESLSAYARQFLEQMEKPDVDAVTGLSPAIAIDQRTTVSHPRSTVGTVSEIYDYLRVLFAAVGRPHCPRCSEPIASQSAAEIAEILFRQPPGTPVALLAPVARGRKGAFKTELMAAVALGFKRARIDGKAASLEPLPTLEPRRNHKIDVLVDRLVLRAGAEARLRTALERALDLAHGVVLVSFEGGKERLYSRTLSCVRCDVSLPEMTPRAFSFNSAYGACPECDGLGVSWAVDPARVVPDESKSLLDGAIHPWQRHGPRLLREALEELAGRHAFSLEAPFSTLSRKVKDLLLHGDGNGFAGAVPYLERRATDLLEAERREAQPGADGGEAFEDLKPYLTLRSCPSCKGARLRPESLAVRVGGRSVAEYVKLTVADAASALLAVTLPEREKIVADRLIAEIVSRLRFLEAVGVGYLALDRPTTTLSGGEAHRIRLAAQIGARMQGVLYVLDEPSVGLHQRDNLRLLETLQQIRDLGNTVVVVEHDEETIKAADYVVDLGEGAGRLGGRVMYEGPPQNIDGSLTGRYLRRELRIEVPAVRRVPRGAIRILGARAHNLRNLDVAIPLAVLTAVTGVSGSGKSTLVDDILHRSLLQKLQGSGPAPGAHRGLEGAEAVDRVIAIDQSPIGRTPRSNPATYTGAFSFIRELFSLTPEARARGYKPGRFSFNVKGGRCEACQGDGVRRVEMHFLPDVYVGCEVCKGRRYNRETLEVLYRGKSIADLLDITVAEAAPLLSAHPRLKHLFDTMIDVGLGYLRLGQSGSTLSGGEAQRLKLARELGRRETGNTLYLLDEPTTGLHFDDVRKLLHVLSRLVDAGNTVVVIEHNLDVVKTADHIIDLGPEAGEAGGRIVAEGSPEEVARSLESHTARYLRPLLVARNPIADARS